MHRECGRLIHSEDGELIMAQADRKKIEAKDNEMEAQIREAKRDFSKEMELLKPFLRKKSHRVQSTTKEWEVTNSDA